MQSGASLGLWVTPTIGSCFYGPLRFFFVFLSDLLPHTQSKTPESTDLRPQIPLLKINEKHFVKVCIRARVSVCPPTRPPARPPAPARLSICPPVHPSVRLCLRARALRCVLKHLHLKPPHPPAILAPQILPQFFLLLSSKKLMPCPRKGCFTPAVSFYALSIQWPNF